MRLIGTDGVPTVLDCPEIRDEQHHPIPREELESAVKALKLGKSAEVDNYTRISPSRKISHNRHADLDLQQDLEDRGMVDHMDSIPKKGNLHLCQNYRTFSAIIEMSC